MAALTVNDPTFQPGFESVDTTIAAGIGLYGYYGSLGNDERVPSSPRCYVTSAAPPLFVLHGDNDTLTPVEGARLLVNELRKASSNPVVYAELPGAQHSFDFCHSIRFDTAVNAIEGFAAWVRSVSGTGRGAGPSASSARRCDPVAAPSLPDDRAQ